MQENHAHDAEPFGSKNMIFFPQFFAKYLFALARLSENWVEDRKLTGSIKQKILREPLLITKLSEMDIF